MKASVIPLLLLSLLVAACDEPVISDEIPVSERGEKNRSWYGEGSNWNRGAPSWEPVRPNSFKIKCPFSDPYKVSYSGDGGNSIKTDFGGSQVLRRVRSGSGEKYSNGEYEIWLNGDDALLTNYLGNSVECKISG